MNKNSIIDTIDKVGDLSKLIEDLLVKMGLENVNRVSENLIEATQKTALKNQKIYFLITLSELNGKVEVLDERIKKINSKYDQLYVVTSNGKLSNYFKDWLNDENPKAVIEYWSKKEVIDNINDYYEDYWSHNDTFLKPYEISFNDSIQADKHLKSLLKLDDKYDKLLEIFIEPKLYIYKEDSETETLTKSRVNKDKIVKSGNYILSGEAGTGKSTLLKEIGKELIEKNKELIFKNIPVLIKASSILESKFDIKTILDKELLKIYKEFDIERIYNEYQIILIIDSIDEFERDNQLKVLNEIHGLKEDFGIRFIIGTRNYDYLVEGFELNDHIRVNLNNFDMNQVKLFLDNFFRFNLEKSDKLWVTLHDNNILEKIPITPLTVSLISILFEEKQYEIPATITDIYDNFNVFLLGRTSVKSSLEFLDITIKERILSIYAVDIIEDPNNTRKSIEEFESSIKKFFKGKNITIKDEVYPELLKSLTQGTGVLYVDENGKIDFKHDYFMEYYASREIFNQRRDLVPTLIENFTKFSWQNTAIFFTGRTKDMPDFLRDLLIRVDKYTELKDELIASSGLGYILQSLWLTDSDIRKDGVIKSLELLIKADQDVKRLSSTLPIFKNLRDTDIALMNFFWFFNHFNSKTLEDTLKLAFDHLSEELDKIEDTGLASDIVNLKYKLFCIGATLTSDKFDKNDKLDLFYSRKNTLSNPIFALLFDNGLDIIDPKNKDELKDRYKLKSRLQKMQQGIKYYLENGVDVTRFTSLEAIKPIKKVEIYTEGKTDAVYMMQAFKALTGNTEPYWNVESCEIKTKKEGGGTHELAKTLNNIAKEMDNGKYQDKTIIGVFDNDASGHQEFNGFKNEDYEIFKTGVVKKHKTKNIYAIILPIPEELAKYNQAKQEFKFFEIEHYFEEDFLDKNKMLTKLEIDGLFEITGSKGGFADEIKTINEPQIYKRFENLFFVIDEINEKEVDYF
ncbi:nucleoside-triphosphatase THEP1 [Aquimarina sp. EL_43]|uniref:NACHT domain-containing protein n=1 Tax=unclassified Aquimarina TaxID=2627091 RepID=UPI0018CAD947|nr:MULTISPECIES: NACHT domain-containing protein [unclassified Aquimarina]MBG6129530.1 nucleoside-triphosphatase THEP1 [Aquimarina sp. EL_35]MBG6150595.1 nucleoside-triphosphatase THEP1 [Aquimarina sp. EL_32]MBG6168097.1 nucleoside-triphosphatase THEP1 [Aquimarina sp. EL_43]